MAPLEAPTYVKKKTMIQKKESTQDMDENDDKESSERNVQDEIHDDSTPKNDKNQQINGTNNQQWNIPENNNSNDNNNSIEKQDSTMTNNMNDVDNHDNDDIESLNTIYGNRIGILQSLSLIINVGLMIYAHIGVSALILSNQQRIEDQVSSSSSNDNNSLNNNNQTTMIPKNNNNTNITGTGTGACNAYDMDIWYKNDGLINRSSNNNFCSRSYISSNNNGQYCLVKTECNMECFHIQYNYSTECSKCLGITPYCGLQSGCAGICGLDYLSIECETCTNDCTNQLLQCTGFTLDIPTTNSTSTIAPTTTTVIKNETTDSSNNDELYLTNEEICTNQVQDVNWDTVMNREEFYIVYTLKFTNAVQDAWNGNARILAFIVVLFSGIWPYIKNIILMLTWYMKLSNKRRDTILTWLKRLGKYSFVDIYAVIVIMVGVLITANIADVPVIVTAEPRGAIVSFLVATLWECIHTEWMIHLHLHYYHTCQKNRHNSQSSYCFSPPYTSISCDQLQKVPLDQNYMTTTDLTTTVEDNDKVQDFDDEDIIKVDKENAVDVVDRKSSVIYTDDEPVHRTSKLHKLYFQDYKKDITSGKRSNLVCKSHACLQVYMIFMIITVLVTLLVGSIIECISFTTYVGNDKYQGCKKSYSLYTLATEMTTENFMDGNSAPYSTWFMYLSYIFLVGFSPLFVILIHIYVIGIQQQLPQQIQHKASSIICRIADSVWSFASIEILLLAIVLVQHKFDDLVGALAGNQNSAFFGITSTLGTGFYILIVYSFFAGLLQYFFNSAISEYYHIDPFHKIDYMFSWMFRCFLQKE